MGMEEDFLNSLRTGAVGPTRNDVPLGIGDDAAIVAFHGHHGVIATDLIAEGSHFKRGELTNRQIGRKGLAVNLSDMAAMAATPRVATVGLLLPRVDARAIADEVTAGIVDLACQFETDVVGGDTNVWDGGLVVCVTILGELLHGPAWRRDGALVDDAIVVTGQLGGSLLGHHHSFTPRVREAEYLRQHYRINAGIDISDGLGLDLSRMMAASRVGAHVDMEAIPIADAARERASRTGSSARMHAWSDGEDFELLLALPPDDAHRMCQDRKLNCSATIIGRVVAEQGMWETTSEETKRLTPNGYEH